ncbi:hypothetical protein TNCV_4124721 [Trichonephila clavipes]|nr:hypothetical protein TNCV_4124721 [Trichonephila clavipes]
MQYRQIPSDALVIAWKHIKRHRSPHGCLQTIRFMLPRTEEEYAIDVACCPLGLSSCMIMLVFREENSILLECVAKVRLLKLLDADHELEANQPNPARVQ